MKKENYIYAKIDIAEIDFSDVIATSGQQGDGGDDGTTLPEIPFEW